jgi:peroxiredoxin
MGQASSDLAVGDVAPSFALQTSDGQEVRLSDVLKRSAALVVFIRGTW